MCEHRCQASVAHTYIHACKGSGMRRLCTMLVAVQMHCVISCVKHRYLEQRNAAVGYAQQGLAEGEIAL